MIYIIDFDEDDDKSFKNRIGGYPGFGKKKTREAQKGKSFFPAKLDGPVK